MRAGASAELDAAGITDDRLRADYTHCRRLAAGHGRTYFLATRLLPAERRPAVHALYGFARTADEIVDDLLPAATSERARRLDELAAQVRKGPAAEEPSCRAAADTAARYDIAPALFEEFLASMRMDLTVTEYATYDELTRYMRGSAAVIGEQMVPVLGTVGPAAEARPYASDLGIAFQLTNFIRDVGEDLRRGRVYLPQDAMQVFGVDRARLHRGVIDGPIRQWLAHEIARARGVYERARPGLERLDPRTRPCVHTAFTLYRDILAEVQRSDYQVLHTRVSVPIRRRLPVASVGLVHALIARRSVRGDPARPSWTGSG